MINNGPNGWIRLLMEVTELMEAEWNGHRRYGKRDDKWWSLRKGDRFTNQNY